MLQFPDSKDLAGARAVRVRYRPLDPIPTGPVWQRVEILYTAAGESWTRLGWHPPLPGGPLLGEFVRTIWRLPPGYAPVNDKAIRLPGGPTPRMPTQCAT